MNKQLVAGAVLAATLAVSAHAADLSVAPISGPIIVPAFTWNGFYVGFNVGGHIGTDKVSTLSTPGPRLEPASAAGIDAGAPTTLNPAGIEGGMQAGYNWQFGRALIGIEADANWLGGTANNTFTFLPTNNTLTDSVSDQFLATGRARLGWVVWDRGLLYATGGVAVANVNFNDLRTGLTGFAAGNAQTPHLVGWTAGAGFEYAFADRWTVKAEYLHVDLGSTVNVIPIDAVANIAVTHKYTDDIARVGVNYLIGWY
jgi:outer membrane immunogenic protein